jgi:cation:H+ antiporter
MIISSRREQKIKHDIPEDEDVLEPGSVNRNLEILRLIAGIVILLIGARLTVDNAEMLAHAIGISERIIGITVIAIGTSLPELVTSVMAAFRKESDIAIGNVVGSNIFNIVGILGITSLVKPLTVAPRINEFDAWVMLGFSLLLIPFVWNAKVGRFEAALFLIAYGSFIIFTLVIVPS